MKLRVILFVLFTCLTTCFTYAIQPAIISKENSGKFIGKNIFILKDSTRSLEINDVVKLKDKFVKSNQEVPNLGVDGANNWIRFSLKNISDEKDFIINLSQENIDEVAFYWRHISSNDSIGSTNIKKGDFFDLNHQFELFKIHIEKGEEIECYIKVFSYTQVSAPISISNTKGLYSLLFLTDMFSTVYTGLMLSMILYNIFLYFTTKETHYITYVNYIFWVVIAQLAILGLLEILLSLDDLWIKSRLLTFTGAISGIAAIFFVKSFLQTSENSPKFNNLLNIFIVGYIVVLLLLLFGYITPAYKMVNVIAGGGSTIVLILAFRLSREKYRQTKYFLFAWCIFLISVLIYVLKDYNVLPYNFFTLRSVQIGSFIEAILLSFALGDKINVYRKEKEESQSRALKILLENERLIREQNSELELKVKERTHDLTLANESLTSTLKHLKDTQSQLVEAEKMASLGQLTAGVAHEINNPINFVTSNVAPLKRDVNMVWETLDEIEHIAMAEDLSIEEKKVKINLYKEEIDLDYLKTEIDFLLKGMHDGASRTAEIVKSLRIFSRVDEDTIKLADINEGLESTLVILSSVIKEGIIVEKSYGEIPQIECYAGKLNQVFLNILTNAVFAVNKKFPLHGGGLLTIKTGMIEDQDSAYISIADNGIGIPEDIKNRIFEPFFTTKDVGEGTGLGMSIAYNTINKHNGKILLDSVLGEGTTFTIVIPIRQTV